MVVTTEEFVAYFHSLDGITIGEKRKNLFLLLNNTQDSQQHIDFNSITPRNPLEETFKVEILIRYRKIPELIEVLKSENPILIEKILKVSSWVLEEILQHVGDESVFIEQTFPYLSFNAKTKIVNKLALHLRNSEKADKLFNTINKQYGSYLASKLLPCCSKQVILSCLRASRIEITSRQLLIIVERNFADTEEILEALREYNSKEIIQQKYGIVFKHIARNDLSLFLKLRRTYYKPWLRLGWRSTENITDKNKELVVNNSKDLYCFVHKKQIVKSLSSNFNEFYFNLLPSLKELKDNYNSYLYLIPANLPRFNLVLATFEKKYNMNLWEQSDFVTAGLLELMSINEREMWMNSNPKPAHFNEESWMCLMKIEKSVPALKKKISLTSDMQERAELIGCLVETCRINNDKLALTSVLKYVLVQHRNDSSSVLYCFMNTIKKCFQVDDLLEEHWKYINDIAQIFVARKEIPFYYFEWLYSYIAYRLSNELPIKTELKEISEKMHMNAQCNTYMKKKHLQKKFLISYGEIIPDICKEDVLEQIFIEFLGTITTWNRKNPKDKISLCIFKGVFDVVLKYLNKERTYTSQVISEIVFEFWHCSEFDEDKRNLLLDALFKTKCFSYDMRLFEWLIRYQPLLVNKYMDSILSYILDMWYTALTPFFWFCCKNYYHLEIPQKIIATCLSILNSKEDSDVRKKNSITALSHLMDSETFINLIKPYYPSDKIIDVNNKENQEIYKIQQSITVNLKNVIPPSKIIESVLYFAKGDYLKYIQRSLYSVSHNAPEIKLINFFTLLSDCPVSVRKHAIFLGFKVLSKSEIYKILALMKQEKNSSIIKFIFRACFNNFCRDPTERLLWDAIKYYIGLLDMNDKEALDILMDINKIPKTFMVDYIMFTWEFLDNHKNKEETLFITAKILLLNSIDCHIIYNLPKAFCMSIIEKYFSKVDKLTDLQKAIISFTAKSLIYSPAEDKEEYFGVIMNLLKEYTQFPNWEKSEAKEILSFFSMEFCRIFRNNLSSNIHIIKRFLDHWNELLKPYQAFAEYLYLNNTLIFSNLNASEISVKLVEFCDNLLGVYGIAVADLFCTSLKPHVSDFLNEVVKDTDENLREQYLLMLIENIIGFSNSINCLVMAISLLPKQNLKTPKLKEKYRKIMKILENSSDLRVQLYLSLYLESLKSDEAVEISHGGLRAKRKSKKVCYYIVHYECKYKK